MTHRGTGVAFTGYACKTKGSVRGLSAIEKRPDRRSRRGKQRVRLIGQPVGQKPNPFTDAEIEHENSVGQDGDSRKSRSSPKVRYQPDKEPHRTQMPEYPERGMCQAEVTSSQVSPGFGLTIRA
jgi:hypothetical protein